LSLAAVSFLPSLVRAIEPADPGYPSQAPMWRQISAPVAWDSTTGSAKIVVAVIDTGLDLTRDDIKDNVWVNEDEIPFNGIDDDRNGYVDDVNGWNFIDINNDISGYTTDNEADHEVASHGTAIAGL